MNTRLIKRLLPAIVAIALIFAFAAPSQAAYSVVKEWVRFSATTGEAITAGHVVAIKDADGYAYKADADDATLRPAVGIAAAGAASGAKVEILVIGIMRGWTALSEGAFVYCSGTAGGATQVAPAWSQNIGVAISATEIYFNFGAYLDTTAVTALGTLLGASPIVLEGATANAFETTITVADPTAANAVNIANASGTIMLSSLATNAPDIANSIWGISNGLAFGGATGADGFEMQLKPMGDPAADQSALLPVTTNSALMISALTTNDVDVANSVWGISNGLAFGGLTGADGFEMQLKPMGDPAADQSALLPVTTNSALMISALTTNDVDVANSVWGISNGLAFGGLTGADGFELQLKPLGDPAADKIVYIPVGNDAVAMISTLATNDVDVANSVWGASNGEVFEGATANAFETTLTVEDPTVDRTITLPDYSGGVPLVIVQGTTQTSQGDASTIDVTGMDVTLAAGWLTAGKVLHFVVEGVITNTNGGDKSVELYLVDGDVVTLTLAGALAGDYMAEFWIYEHTDAANQDVYGRMFVSGQSIIFDRSAQTKDVSAETHAKIRLTLADAADAITVESYRIETWKK